jgi:hypothetical protein
MNLVSRGHCLAESGESYLVYLDSAQPVSVELNGGEYSVTWIDARQPQTRHETDTTRDGRNLMPPSGGDDWLVLLQRLNAD